MSARSGTVLPLRYTILWLLGGWVLVLGAVVGSLTPSTAAVAILHDKLLHFGAYLLMTFWFTGIYRRHRYAAIGLGLLALGIALELLQARLLPTRSGSYGDLLANAGGIAAGLGLALGGLGGWCVRIEDWLHGTAAEPDGSD